MDEQLDNDLSNHIREVFDNFDDDSYPSADEGWLLLREKFPETEKKRPVAWLWWASTAAALLLFVSLGVWMTNKKQQPQTIAIKQTKQEQTSLSDTGKLLATKQAPTITTHPAAATTASIADTDRTAAQYAASKAQANKLAQGTSAPGATAITAPTNQVSVQQPVNNVLLATQKAKQADSTRAVTAKTNTQQIAATVPAVTGSNPVIPPTAQNAKSVSSTQPPVVTKPAVQQFAVNPPTVNGSNTIAPAAKNTAVSGSSATVPQSVIKVPKQVPPPNSMAALFANEKNNPQKPAEEYTEDKKVRFGVYAATFFNYAKGSSNQINAGAGFTSEIKLSKNIKLSTGVALAQNTLSYNGSGPPSNGDFYAAALAKAPQALTFDRQGNLFSANANFPVLKNYNANLVGLDIPLNIKYEFNPQTSDAYISAGLSSGTFINEAYTSVYGYSASSVAAGASSNTTDDVTRKNFTGFYFAKTLNVSFGVGYPMGKNRLIIEPFLKYPLDGLGAQQIRFGAGGLNLKFNFTTKK
ncbi:MAG: hypothetical protein JWR38_3905 [Mucilaginibacter sp.]|nr:hypothetical protein [Mucilaginibacter sp.]